MNTYIYTFMNVYCNYLLKITALSVKRKITNQPTAERSCTGSSLPSRHKASCEKVDL